MDDNTRLFVVTEIEVRSTHEEDGAPLLFTFRMCGQADSISSRGRSSSAYGGKSPAAIRRRRSSTRSGWFILST